MNREPKESVVPTGSSEDAALRTLASCGDLHSAMRHLEAHGGFEHLDHWQQGEFHHDHVLRVDAARLGLEGAIVVVATNCNGAVKEVLNFAQVPGRWALWGWRVPENPDFQAGAATPLSAVRSPIWFDPRRLLLPETRSELRPECRRRQRGGGWVPVESAEE